MRPRRPRPLSVASRRGVESGHLESSPLDERRLTSGASLPRFDRSLGLPADVGFHDIFGLDPDLLAMVRATRVDPAPRRRRPNPTR